MLAVGLMLHCGAIGAPCKAFVAGNTAV